MTLKKSWSPFPDQTQTLLLKACLLEEGACVESWHAWQSAIHVEDVDLGSQRLLPLLHNKLNAYGISHPDMERYKSVARYMWLDNQLRARKVTDILDLLRGHGVHAALLKGLSLASLYYDDWSLRPTSDIDILVPLRDVRRVAQVLQDSGWHCVHAARLSDASFLATRHAVHFHDSVGTELDLHWHVLEECCHNEMDRFFWSDLQTFDLNGRDVPVLGDSDQFMHVCVHGMRHNTVSPMRWIVDATMIMRRSDIDWTRFINLAVKGKISRRLATATSYLRNTFDLAIPEEVIDTLVITGSNPVERWEKILERETTPVFMRNVGYRYIQYQRGRMNAESPSNFLAYLQVFWGKSDLVSTVQEVLRRLTHYAAAAALGKNRDG